MISIKLGRAQLGLASARATRALIIGCLLLVDIVHLLGMQVGEGVRWHAELYLTFISCSCDAARQVRLFLVRVRC